MSTELLNCPFCGHQMAPKLISTTEWRDEFDMHYEGEDGNVECFAVMCNASKPSGPGGCGASGGFHETRVAAIAAWNRRAATPAKPVEGWISVEDRLPEKKAGAYLVATIAKKEYPEGSNYPGMGIRAVAQDWNVRNYASHYTHWMPLPSPPAAPQAAPTEESIGSVIRAGFGKP